MAKKQSGLARPAVGRTPEQSLERAKAAFRGRLGKGVDTEQFAEAARRMTAAGIDEFEGLVVVPGEQPSKGSRAYFALPEAAVFQPLDAPSLDSRDASPSRNDDTRMQGLTDARDEILALVERLEKAGLQIPDYDKGVGYCAELKAELTSSPS